MNQISLSHSDLAVGHTTHLTTADQHGNVVAITQTLGPNMGSKVATKGLGFLYNVTMGPYLGGYFGEDKPGDRASSHISPTLFTNEDEVVLALGAAGGQRIITAITQVAYRYLAQNSPLADALYLPRYYKNDGILYIESHLGINRINAQLFPSRYNVERIPHKAYFGRVHAVALDSLKSYGLELLILTGKVLSQVIIKIKPTKLAGFLVAWAGLEPATFGL